MNTHLHPKCKKLPQKYNKNKQHFFFSNQKYTPNELVKTIITYNIFK